MSAYGVAPRFDCDPCAAPCDGGGVEPLTPTVETSPAAHIAPIVSARTRRGVSQPRWWFCSESDTERTERDNPEQRAAVREVKRVLRPGGKLILLEHVRSPIAPVRSVQRLLDPLMVRFEADHIVRDPLDYLAEEGFEVQDVTRLKWGIVERTVARKPQATAVAAA